MKTLITLLLSACFLFNVASCKSKQEDIVTPTNNNAQLIVGVFTATKIEGSNTNNGTDWKDITAIGAREVLTIKSDNTFNSLKSNPTTGATTTPVNGTWSLSTDGNTLTYVGIQSYTIATLTATSLVTVLVGPNKLANVDAATYGYFRFTYSR